MYVRFAPMGLRKSTSLRLAPQDCCNYSHNVVSYWYILLYNVFSQRAGFILACCCRRKAFRTPQSTYTRHQVRRIRVLLVHNNDYCCKIILLAMTSYYPPRGGHRSISFTRPLHPAVRSTNDPSIARSLQDEFRRYF